MDFVLAGHTPRVLSSINKQTIQTTHKRRGVINNRKWSHPSHESSSLLWLQTRGLGNLMIWISPRKWLGAAIRNEKKCPRPLHSITIVLPTLVNKGEGSGLVDYLFTSHLYSYGQSRCPRDFQEKNKKKPQRNAIHQWSIIDSPRPRLWHHWLRTEKRI